MATSHRKRMVAAGLAPPRHDEQEEKKPAPKAPAKKAAKK